MRSACVCVCVCPPSREIAVRRISLGGEGNALYPVLSSCHCYDFVVAPIVLS